MKLIFSLITSVAALLALCTTERCWSSFNSGLDSAYYLAPSRAVYFHAAARRPSTRKSAIIRRITPIKQSKSGAATILFQVNEKNGFLYLRHSTSDATIVRRILDRPYRLYHDSTLSCAPPQSIVVKYQKPKPLQEKK